MLTHKPMLLGTLVTGLVLAAPRPAAAADAATRVGSQTCAGCHSDKSEAFKNTLHGQRLPVVKKLEPGSECETCHGPGSSHAEAAGDRSQPGFASIKGPTTGSATDLVEMCLSCHKDAEVNYWGVSAHKQANLSCGSCHSIHAAKDRKALRRGSTETCLECHSQEKIGLNLPSHHPVREGKMTCSSCHNPHGGPNGNLRAATAEELCFKCHAEKAGPFAYEHPPVAEDCSICHLPHGSLADNLLKQRQPSLCLTCHKWPHTEATNNQPAFFRPLKFYERAHCANCHREIHGSDRKSSFVP